MKPDRIEFRIGETRFKQPVQLVMERGSDGLQSWTIYRDEANQRDERVMIAGLDASTIERMADAVKGVRP